MEHGYIYPGIALTAAASQAFASHMQTSSLASGTKESKAGHLLAASAELMLIPMSSSVGHVSYQEILGSMNNLSTALNWR